MTAPAAPWRPAKAKVRFAMFPKGQIVHHITGTQTACHEGQVLYRTQWLCSPTGGAGMVLVRDVAQGTECRRCADVVFVPDSAKNGPGVVVNGWAIHEIRRALHLSKEVLAQEAAVPVAAISVIETGHRRVVPRVANAIANALCLTSVQGILARPRSTQAAS